MDLDTLDLGKAIKKISDKLQKAVAVECGQGDNEEDEEINGLDSEDMDEDDASVGGWSDEELQISHEGDDHITKRLGEETPEIKAKRIKLWRDLKVSRSNPSNAFEA